GRFLRALLHNVKSFSVSGNSMLAPNVLRNQPPPACAQPGAWVAAMAFETERMRLPAAASRRAQRRAALFREGLLSMTERWILGIAWALSPKRIRGLPNLLTLCFDEFLAPDYALPEPDRAADEPPGLAGIVHDLSVPTLLAGYQRGLYPFAHIAP